jgi:hypothetical protein
MFYTEEDVQPAVTKATELFGPVGNIKMGNNVIRDTMIATREFGKIWYGDIDFGNDPSRVLREHCRILSQKIGQKVYVFGPHNQFAYTDSNLFS